jgi:putative ABC transport system ATP-binding protein
MMPLLERPTSVLVLENVRKSFREPDGRELPILHVGQFRLGHGEQAVLVGPSGCGKTTLLHVIAGIRRADGGRILVNGTDLLRLSEAGRDRFRAANVGYIFQTFNLLPAFSALENVLLGMTFSRGRRDESRAKHVLARVGLAPRARHKPAALSVGEQQRVAVARALANRPHLLLADEPTANVDRGNQQQIIDLIRDTCREERVALLLVTHSREVAEQFDRVEHYESLNRPAVAELVPAAQGGSP